MSAIDDLTPEEALAIELVDEAIRGMKIPREVRLIVQVKMYDELLHTPKGPAQLWCVLASEPWRLAKGFGRDTSS